MSKHSAKSVVMALAVATTGLVGLGCASELESATVRGRTLALDGRSNLMEPAPAPLGAHVYVAWMLPEEGWEEEQAMQDFEVFLPQVSRSAAFDHGFAGTGTDPTVFVAEGIQPPPPEAIAFWGNAIGVIAVADPSCADDGFIGAVDHNCAKEADELLIYHPERGQQPELEFVRHCRPLAEHLYVTDSEGVETEVSETDCVTAPADNAIILEPGFNLVGWSAEERELMEHNSAYSDACYRGADGDQALIQACYDRHYEAGPDPVEHLLPLDTEIAIAVPSEDGDE